MTVTRYDLRDERLALSPKIALVRGKAIERPLSQITGVTVHQMAIAFGLTRAQIAGSRGDRSLAMARRASTIACHAAAFRTGESVLATPIRWDVNHANALNDSTLGLEIDGLHPGLDDDPATLPQREDLATLPRGRTATEWTPLAIETARDALRWLVETARAEGCPIEWVWAHRQSNGTRRADPSERIWRDVVLALATELHLRTDLERTWPHRYRHAVTRAWVDAPGRQIPRAWDPAATAGY